MKRSLIDLVLGLAVGAGCGYFVAVTTGASFLGGPAASSTQASAHAGHRAALELDPSAPAPTLKVTVERDETAGWNLHLDVTSFRFAPERSGRAHQPGEGHAHLHVDGRKVARLYGSWFHLSELPPGKATVEVALYSNDHRALHHRGKPLRTALIVDND